MTPLEYYLLSILITVVVMPTVIKIGQGFVTRSDLIVMAVYSLVPFLNVALVAVMSAVLVIEKLVSAKTKDDNYWNEKVF